MKLFNHFLLLALICNAVSCSSRQEPTLPSDQKDYWEKTRERFTGFDRFR